MSGVELLPCPFCGAPGKFIEENRTPMVMVMCGADCELMPQTDWYDREEAACLWNTRTPAQGLDAATIERCVLAEENTRLREALGVAKRAILRAAQDTLWCDDSPAETVVDRIDSLLDDAPLMEKR